MSKCYVSCLLTNTYMLTKHGLDKKNKVWFPDEGVVEGF